jgi:hypothetical protein
MHETPNSAIEDGLALENARGSAAAHLDDIAARERNDPARDRGGDGCFVEHREPRPLFTAIPGSLALQAALANRQLIRITVFYGPAALGAKGLVLASLPIVVASTL